MGLDWRALGKPKPGCEERFTQLFDVIHGPEQHLDLFDILEGKQPPKIEDEVLEEWFSIQIPSFETIKAPRVGRDVAANEWLKNEYATTDKSLSFDAFAKKYDGLYVVELAEETDGIPVYVGWFREKNAFRAKVLYDCEDLIGDELFNEAWVSKLADEALHYGQQLLSIADQIASENGLQYLRAQREPPGPDKSRLERQVHILFSAGKWLTFYGRNGHGYEADY